MQIRSVFSLSIRTALYADVSMKRIQLPKLIEISVLLQAEEHYLIFQELIVICNLNF